MGTPTTPIAGPPWLSGRAQAPGPHGGSTDHSAFAVCSVCKGPASAGTSRCWSCRQVLHQLEMAPPVVVPSFMFEIGSPVHVSLVGYKAAATDASRLLRQEALAAWLGAFLGAHLSCLSPGRREPIWLVPVPSSTGGRLSWNGSHPLVSLCGLAARQATSPNWRQIEVLDVLRVTDGPPARLSATQRGYVPDLGSELLGRSVIAVDDVFVSGARLLSAAAALSLAGARVVAALPMGRLVRPAHNSATLAYWARYGSRPATLESCAACRVTRRLACTSPGVVERLAA
ncbi:MAG: hypothetical protein ACRD0Z_14650 [Acidimicrobiales bacterium]